LGIEETEKQMAKRANEIIAFHLGWDIREVSDGRYQNYTSPGVYVCSESYFAAPTKGQKLPRVSEKEWYLVGEYYGREVWRVDP
jgi:hypothetical protein